MTRACTSVPVISRKASAIHSQESSSRPTMRAKDGLTGGGASSCVAGCVADGTAASGFAGGRASAFTAAGLLNMGDRCDRCEWCARLVGLAGRRGALGHLELNVFGEIEAGVARRTEAAGVVTDGAPQAFEREIAHRIGAQELANLFQGALGGRESGSFAIGQAPANAGDFRGQQFFARG